MSIRQEKIANVIKKELGVFFQKNAASICQGAMVSVTTVRMSPDLSIAKIYLSIFGGKNNDEVFYKIACKKDLIPSSFGLFIINSNVSLFRL